MTSLGHFVGTFMKQTQESWKSTMQHSHGPAPIQQHHLLFSRSRNGANCTRAPIPYAQSVSVFLSVNKRCHGQHHAGNSSEWLEWLDLSYPNRRNYNEVPGWAGEFRLSSTTTSNLTVLRAVRPPPASTSLDGNAPVVARKITIPSWHIMAHA